MIKTADMRYKMVTVDEMMILNYNSFTSGLHIITIANVTQSHYLFSREFLNTVMVVLHPNLNRVNDAIN